ncbi:PAS domain-containing protein [Geobacter sulfurreducens]|nr:PAS domain-containing protein [Geobacter sulfurreducens]BBA69582.1 Phytochrome-like protein cph1 [Geobacter sulfurreducens]
MKTMSDPPKNGIESIIVTTLVALTAFWFADTVIDTVIPQMGCECGRLHAPTVLASLFHLIPPIAQLLLIFFVRRLFRDRRLLVGKLEAAVATTLDEKARTDAVIAAVGDGVCMLDRDFRIVYQNRAHERLLGEHGGERCSDAYGEDPDACRDCPMVRAMDTGEVCTGSRRFISKGETRLLEITSSPVRNAAGEIVAGVEVVRDVTERRRSEEEIKSLNAALERRARDLAANNRELEAFSHSLSHDLSAPLAKISCAVETLREIYGEQMGDDGRFLLSCICEGSSQMDDLMEALLALNQVSRKELRREKVDMGALVSQLALDLRRSEPARRVDFVIAPDLTAEGDPSMLRVALQNLLSNAWKFTRNVDGGRIEFGSVDRNGERVFYLRDNGAGFDMRQVGRIFEVFQRLHDETLFPGTGVGLATVQRVVERHGGTVTAHGVPGHGATFTFTLP